jgi:predicted nucleic acid-binding protein
VLDSSAALRAAASDRARASLQGRRLIAPPLLWSEVTSALHEATWRRQIDASEAHTLRRSFADLGVRPSSPRRLLDVAWEIADELGLAKTYDAEFLALARISGALVLTTDARLRRGADRTGLVIDPTELESGPR